MRGLVLLALALATAGCALEPSKSGEAVTDRVNISGSAFQPGTAHVTRGQTVTFTNQDATTHNIRWDGVPSGASTAESSNLGKGATFEYTPAVSGQYDYHCGIHSGMKGTLVVAEGGT